MTSENLGFGLGLRSVHYKEILNEEETLPIDWFEALTENYLGLETSLSDGAKPLDNLLRIRERFPMSLHGVSLNIGSSDPLNMNYLKKVKQLAGIIDAKEISDHLCWTGVGGENLHDLLPLPYTREVLNHIAARVHFVQEFYGCPLALENVSSYLTFRHSEMQEWEFLSELVKVTGCKLLLDVNNVYVSSVNHGFDPKIYLNALPLENIVQVHLAGHTKLHTHLVDTHDQDICGEVWSLFGYIWPKISAACVMIERDDNIPALSKLCDELSLARQHANAALALKTSNSSRLADQIVFSLSSGNKGGGIPICQK